MTVERALIDLSGQCGFIAQKWRDLALEAYMRALTAEEIARISIGLTYLERDAAALRQAIEERKRGEVRQ